jgi:hypothetical protein
VAKSAARLAAEAAFGNPPAPQAPPRAVQIVVRRSRTPSQVVQSAASADLDPPVEAAVKRGRVFLVGGAHAPPSGEATSPLAPPPKADPKPKGDVASNASRPSRPRRSAVDKARPGPLLQVSQAPRVQPPEAAPKPLGSDLLMAALAPVTPVLEFVARAQAFVVSDANIEIEWLRVSLRVAACQAELQARLR